MKRRTSLLLALLLAFFASSSDAMSGRYVAASGSGEGATWTYPWYFGIWDSPHTDWAFGGGPQPGSVRNGYQMGKVIDTLNVLGAPILLISGDLSEDSFDPNAASYREGSVDTLNAKIARFHGLVLPTLGNHDATPTDTLAQRNPFYSAINRFPNLYQGRNYYSYDFRNIRFVSLQNSANYNISGGDDYRINNPTSYAAPSGGITGYDYDGITNPSSPQRLWLASITSRTSVGAKWLIFQQNRAIYGCNSNSTNRQNFGRAARGTGYVKAIEDSLPTGIRAGMLSEDQHIGMIVSNAIRDSAVASATGKGIYHLQFCSGAGQRQGDSTSVPAGFYNAYMWRNGLNPYTTVAGRTSTEWADTLTSLGDKLRQLQYTWALATVYADMIKLEVFVTWQPGESTSHQFTGAGCHRLVHTAYLRRDVRG